MIDCLKSRSNRAWLLLVLATVAGFGIGDRHGLGAAAGVATLLLAYAKGRLVMLDFMELRHAPAVWRGLLEAWLLLVSLAMLAGYLAA